jgi:hypothetical protein
MTTVTCNAHDASGNAATPKSFTVTVSDTTPPVISNLPGTAGTLSVEANSPSGSSPSYTLPTAVDAVAGPVPVTCVPPPGTLLSIGTHTVTCSASDNATPANTSTATFTIDIVDTTPPVLTVPAPITVSTTGTSVPASTPAIAAFLGSAVAHDIADPAPTVTNNAPATFPLGTTTVTFTAKDASGNTSAASAAVVVVQQAPNTPPPPPPPVVDRTPPDDVTGVQAVGGGGQVILTWTDSTASDFDHVEIVRSDVSGASAVTIYTGNASTFVDSSVRSGTEYRYVITAFDHAGNRSAGIAVLVEPSRAVLVAPAAGAHVTKAPLLAWVAARGATYYNVQLFRGSRKILSLWPGANHLQLPKAWRFGGHKFTLSRGTYTWYVWPGLGARSAKRYGAVLGKSTFVMG